MPAAKATLAGYVSFIDHETKQRFSFWKVSPAFKIEVIQEKDLVHPAGEEKESGKL